MTPVLAISTSSAGTPAAAADHRGDLLGVALPRVAVGHVGVLGHHHDRPGPAGTAAAGSR